MYITPKNFILFGVFTLIILALVNISGCSEKQQYHIGILQWTEKIEPFNHTYQGVIDSLRDKGYRAGVNLVIDYKNVEQDKIKAAEVARSFVKKKMDIIVALGTGSSLAALKATEKNPIPIVYSIVGATEIIHSYKNSGRNITGVSMNVPIRQQFQTLREILPDMKNLGILYSTETPQAVATGKEAASVAAEFGWSQRTNAVSQNELVHLPQIVRSLAKQTDVIYIPIDPLINIPEHLETVISIADESSTPVVGVAKKFVENGVLVALHCDFYEIGRQIGEPIIQALNGVDVHNIPSQKPFITLLSINLNKAQQLDIEIPRDVIIKADNIID